MTVDTDIMTVGSYCTGGSETVDAKKQNPHHQRISHLMASASDDFEAAAGEDDEVDEAGDVEIVDVISRFTDLSTAKGPSRLVAYKTAVKQFEAFYRIEGLPVPVNFDDFKEMRIM